MQVNTKTDTLITVTAVSKKGEEPEAFIHRAWPMMWRALCKAATEHRGVIDSAKISTQLETKDRKTVYSASGWVRNERTGRP